MTIRGTHLLLFHQLCIWAVVHNICTKHRGRQVAVYLLCIDISELSIQDKLIALSTQTDSGLLAKEDEGEDVSILYFVRSS
jgi:hypothetical protein